MNCASRSVTPNLDTEHPVKLAEIGDFDVLAEPGLECVDGNSTASCDHAVVHMHCDDDYRARGFGVFVEHSLVDLALLETEGAENLCEFLIPTSPSLLKPVQGLAKTQNALLRHGRDVHPTWVKSSIETLSNTRV